MDKNTPIPMDCAEIQGRLPDHAMPVPGRRRLWRVACWAGGGVAAAVLVHLFIIATGSSSSLGKAGIHNDKNNAMSFPSEGSPSNDSQTFTRDMQGRETAASTFYGKASSPTTMASAFPFSSATHALSFCSEQLLGVEFNSNGGSSNMMNALYDTKTFPKIGTRTIQYLERLVAEWPESVVEGMYAKLLLAECYWQTGDIERSFQYYIGYADAEGDKERMDCDATPGIDPAVADGLIQERKVDSLFLMGCRLYSQKNDSLMAMKIFDRILTRYPDTMQGNKTLLMMGLLHAKSGDKHSSLACYDALVEKAPGTDEADEAAVNRSVIRFNAGDRERCISELDEYRQKHKKSSRHDQMQYLTGLYASLEGGKFLPLATKYFAELVAKDPGSEYGMKSRKTLRNMKKRMLDGVL